MTSDIVARIQSDFPALAEQMSAVPDRFSPDWLEQRAMAQTGLSDFGPDSYAEPLQRLCDSLNDDANLNAYGLLLLANVIANQLGNRLLLQRERKDHPDRFTGPLIPPIIVTGLPRTGTTFLHRLLAADPAHASLPYWQLNRPIPRGPEDTPEARIAEVSALLDVRRKVTPELDGTHMIRPETPEECMWMVGASGYTRLYWNMAPIHGFMQWYLRTDKTAKYRDYRDLLHWLQGEYPGQRLVLKAPDHNDGLCELLEQIPEARVIITHRDMIEQVGSYMSLGRTTRRLAATTLDTAREAKTVIDITDISLAKMAEARAAHPDRILDLRYTDMMADPLSAVQRIYAFAGLTLSQDRATAITEHHSRNPKGKHGKHEYALAEFGLDTETIKSRYADYSRAFLG